MSHLPIERLAALADEPPGADEQSHLANCADCARELDAIRSLVSLAGAERESMSIPLTRWDSLSARLKAEGLIDRKAHRARYAQRFLQAAAALLLVAGGMAAGRASAGASLVPGGLVTDVAAADSALPSFESAEQAQMAKQFYFDAYQRAVDFLASTDNSARSVGNPSSMRTRLSALDRTAQTMREALNDAPWDPVLNGLYLNSFAEREATLRQLTTALPAGARANSF
jgi:hypothetical protein